jgi:hypothetical protein
MPRFCFCLTGWHFREDIYARLSEVTKKDIFVVSHRPPHMIPNFVFTYIKNRHIFYEANLGYDWGCYQQFIAKHIWKSYDVTFFLHDDLLVHNVDFIPHTLDLLNGGASVVGNGRNSRHLSWPETHTACYAHSQWVPPSLKFQHDTVRGSFLATTAQAIDQMQNFEVFWDPNHFCIRFGNHSLIATSGKFQYLFGERCFAFLGSDYLDSPYIIEEERGGQERQNHLTPKQHIIIWFYTQVGRAYVLQRIPQPRRVPARLTERMRRVLSWVNGTSNKP